jgi:hypothetical protein
MNDFQNGNSSKLPTDVCRCVTKTCHVRDLCARFMDCEPGDGLLTFADLTNDCQDIGAERMFIPWRGVPTQAPDTAALADKGRDLPIEHGEDDYGLL